MLPPLKFVRERELIDFRACPVGPRGSTVRKVMCKRVTGRKKDMILSVLLCRYKIEVLMFSSSFKVWLYFHLIFFDKQKEFKQKSGKGFPKQGT